MCRKCTKRCTTGNALKFVFIISEFVDCGEGGRCVSGSTSVYHD